MLSLVVVGTPGVAAGVVADDVEGLVQRAGVLAGLPADVAVRLVDPELTGDPARVSRLDAFIVREPDGALRRVIYVNLHAPVVRRAVEAPARFLPLLAAVLHHEWQHLRGASEDEARAAERVFLQALAARAEP